MARLNEGALVRLDARQLVRLRMRCLRSVLHFLLHLVALGVNQRARRLVLDLSELVLRVLFYFLSVVVYFLLCGIILLRICLNRSVQHVL